MIEHNATLQEKVVFIDVQFPRRLENLAAHLEGEQEFVHFEETATCVSEHSEKGGGAVKKSAERKRNVLTIH